MTINKDTILFCNSEEQLKLFLNRFNLKIREQTSALDEHSAAYIKLIPFTNEIIFGNVSELSGQQMITSTSVIELMLWKPIRGEYVVLTTDEKPSAPFKVTGIHKIPKGHRGEHFIVQTDKGIKLNLQNIRPALMEETKKEKTLKITKDQAIELIAIACPSWQEKLSKVFSKVLIPSVDEIEISKEFYKEMWDSATTYNGVDQKEYLRKIFGVKNKRRFEVGQWVTFMPEVAEEKNLTTGYWNKPHTLKIDAIDNYSFSSSFTLIFYNVLGRGSVSNNIDCFRVATGEEIKVGSFMNYKSDKLETVPQSSICDDPYPIHLHDFVVVTDGSYMTDENGNSINGIDFMKGGDLFIKLIVTEINEPKPTNNKRTRWLTPQNNCTVQDSKGNKYYCSRINIKPIKK